MSEPDATLKLLPHSLSTSIRGSADEAALRRFACACARYAVSVTGLTEPRLDEALHFSETLGSRVADQENTEELRQVAEHVAEKQDNVAFDAQDAAESGRGTRQTYATAFSRARAAMSVLACFEEDVYAAAASACYEALHATQSLEALERMRTEFLGQG